jgi:hypothetical protein
MRSIGLVFMSMALTAGSVAVSQDAKSNSGSKSKAEPKRITIEDLVTAAPLPANYAISRKDIKDGEKLHGHKLFLTNGDQVSKAIVTVETRKITKREEKVAATKGYVNGLARTFQDAGLKLVEKKIPEIDKNDFSKPLTVDLVYEKTDDGSKLYLQILVFFTDRGYNVAVISDSKEDHDVLTKWARSVKAK